MYRVDAQTRVKLVPLSKNTALENLFFPSLAFIL